MASKFRKVVSTTLSAALVYGSWPANSAMAGACGAGVSGGSGPPSISATEVSTAQALEILRRRKDEQQQPVVLASLSQQPPAQAAPPPPPAAEPPPKPKPFAAAPAPAPKKVEAAPVAPAPAAKKAEPVPAAAPATDAKKTTTLKEDLKPGRKMPPPADKVTKQTPKKPIVREAKPAPKEYYEPAPRKYAAAPSYGGSIKDDYSPRPTPVHGIWVQGYYDYEQVSGWTLLGGTPGGLKSKTETVGVVGGFDRKVANHGDSTWIVGVLGGYENSRATYNNQRFLEVPADNADYLRINAHDDTEGGSVGLYTLLTSPTWSFDALLKFDIFSYDQRDQFIQTNTNAGSCGVLAGPWERQNSSDMFNVILAGNAARRYMMSGNSWFEPVVGFRYTHTDYSNLRQFINAPGGGPALPFGLVDGDVLRLQGGLRYGTAHVLPGDKVWITTIGGFLYSDVLVSGISQNYQDVIEGKIRLMGQLTTALVQANGMTYMLQTEVRGGDNMFGVGVKGGIRYEW